MKWQCDTIYTIQINSNDSKEEINLHIYCIFFVLFSWIICVSVSPNLNKVFYFVNQVMIRSISSPVWRNADICSYFFVNLLFFEGHILICFSCFCNERPQDAFSIPVRTSSTGLLSMHPLLLEHLFIKGIIDEL